MSLLLLHQPHLSADLLELDIQRDIWKAHNKYYSADVPTQIHSILGVDEVRWDDVAALVILFDKSFELEELEELQEVLDKVQEHSDSIEVKLAVGFNSASNADDDLDAHFIAHDVEYIDANSDEQGGLDRVVDSLSTVMWEGMKPRKEEDTEEGTEQAKLNTANPSNPLNSFDDDFDDLLNADDPGDLSSLLAQLNTMSMKVRSIDNIQERHDMAAKFADDLASFIPSSDQDDQIH
ncbi:hypothetical protein E3P99_02997 [Wallemia hederae]|uniref:Alpha-and gamma-adaptin-binding protein p34 n=1 Tax=Wallemia hederae TaxID=1540922 RepID=A0A4T0FHX4_9BASI|nr:hypothetical protein E3P99_02997 [Wallemia hederae]